MQHECRCSRTRREDVSFRDVKIKIPDGKYDQGDVNGVIHRKCARRILGIWEKSGSWVFAFEEEGWLSELAEVLRWVPHMVWGRWKSQHRKIVYLSPYVDKPFNSNVIKSFVPEQRSRKCFLCFGIPMLSMLSIILSNVSHIHGWLCNRMRCPNFSGILLNLGQTTRPSETQQNKENQPE